jgi:tetratricopeptide (TPR) repeat protein
MPNTTRREQLQKMLADDPKDPFLRYALAMEYVTAGDLPGAVGQLATLLADSPDYVPAYQQRGQLLIQLGRPAEARPVLEQGFAAARKAGDQHAAEEIQGILVNLGEV